MARKIVEVSLDQQIAALKAKADEVGITIVRDFGSSEESKQDLVLAQLMKEPSTKAELINLVKTTEKGLDSFISYIRKGRLKGAGSEAEYVKNRHGVNRQGKGLNAMYSITQTPDGSPYFYNDDEKQLWIVETCKMLGVDPNELIEDQTA